MTELKIFYCGVRLDPGLAVKFIAQWVGYLGVKKIRYTMQILRIMRRPNLLIKTKQTEQRNTVVNQQVKISRAVGLMRRRLELRVRKSRRHLSHASRVWRHGCGRRRPDSVIKVE